MKRLVGLAMATLMMCSSVLAGGIFITISGNSGQIKTEAQEFRYAQSPRELAGGSSMATAVAATNARGGSGRASMRRMNEPVAIVLSEPRLAAADGLLCLHCASLLDLTGRIVSPHTDIGKIKISAIDIAKKV